jgi:murein tripeptide amidase MpaA
MPRYRITIGGPDKAAMLDLIRTHAIQVLDHGSGFAPDKGYTVAAFAAPDEILQLRQNGYQVVQHEDRDEIRKIRQQEVGQGNRYTSSDEAPARAAYLNVEEVEAALVAAAAQYSAFAELITLPHPTWEGRQCHALKIGNGSGAGRTGVYFLGGVHAREWGSCDILINFIERIAQAYLNGTALSFDASAFSAADIKSIVDTLDIVIFPQANPDGRNYSMTGENDWRKNLRPAPDAQQQCPGVDINRNYDFLWDFRKQIGPSASLANSAEPCNEKYCGPSAFSEPETKNVRWIVDNFANIRFFIDLHSYGKKILYRWGDAADQTMDPAMTFTNRHYDGLRGDDAYKEYIIRDDLDTLKSLAAVLRGGIKAVRGTEYFIQQTYGLYPTAGTADDYLYSRHLADPSQPKILSYTMEWGEDFHPAYDEMRLIIDEVTAGLLAFCLKIVAMTRARSTV